MSISRQSAEILHFDQTAKRYGASWWGQSTPAGKVRIQRRWDRMGEFLRKHRCGTILEIGCGSGLLTDGIRQKHSLLYATDLSHELLQIAQSKNPGAFLLRSDVTHLPFSDRVFDAIIGDGILHHLELEKALPEIRRVLSLKGSVFFFEPNLLNPQIFAERKIPWIRRLHQTPDETAFIRWEIKKNLSKFWRHVRVEPFDFLHPSIPAAMIGVAERLGGVLEKCAAIRELAGSLWIEASNEEFS